MKRRIQLIGIAGFFILCCVWTFAAVPTLAGDRGMPLNPSWIGEKAPLFLAKKDADSPKKEIPSYAKAMRDAVNQFLAVVESINKQNQPLEWKLQQIYQFNQSVRVNWGNVALTYYIFDEQMRLLDCVDFRQFIGKDFYEWTDTSGNKPFQLLHKELIKSGLGFAEGNWSVPNGQFPVPSIIHGQICNVSDKLSGNITKLVVSLIGPKNLVEAFEEPFRPELLQLQGNPPEDHFKQKPQDISPIK